MRTLDVAGLIYTGHHTWVSCNDAMPDSKGRYLVTNAKPGARIIDIVKYEPERGFISKDIPVAWMPLPRPYPEGGYV